MVLLNRKYRVSPRISRMVACAAGTALILASAKSPSAPAAAVISRAGSEQSLLKGMGRVVWTTLGEAPWFTGRKSSSTTSTQAAAFRSDCGMDREMVALFLQSYNAGPYAVTKFNGEVPYRETRNYVPKVLSFYQKDLSKTPYDSMIVESATRHGLDPQLVRAIMRAESNFRNRTTSHAGARGLMQVMPCTWNAVKKRNGVTWNYSSNVFDPAKNIEVACAYLSWVRYEHLPKHFASFRGETNTPAATGTRILAAAKPTELIGDRSNPGDANAIQKATKGKAIPGAVMTMANKSGSTAKVQADRIEFSWTR